MNRYDFVYFFDCIDANPNGDPDAGNLPRLDVETGHGLVTDVCLKRKVRNYVALTRKETPPHDIYVKEKAVLIEAHEKAYKAIDADASEEDTKGKTKKKRKGTAEEVVKARDWMCQNFYDVRTFGAVMSIDINCGQVRGPAQLAFSRSVDPINSVEHSITRMAVATRREAESQQGDNRTMGRKFTVPYALFRCHGFINPFLAEQTGFSDDDRELLFEALENAFQFDQSAARPAGSMNARQLLVFEHDSQLGSAPSHHLFESTHASLKNPDQAPRAFTDYQIEVDESALPKGIILHRRL
ncbi:MAG: type I-C CRISPR-associated protein Cas7/Csd2 [Opitutales bacterium]